ncbi:hypothetical protein IWZ00DRAFT_545073 [Phyllosticta capitalensis]
MKEFDAVHACFWEDMVKYDTHSPFIPPDAHTTENVWTVRLTEDGFDHQQFPPINACVDDRNLATALQLLFIASPETFLALAKPTGSPWALDQHHPAVQRHERLKAEDRVRGNLDTAWNSVARGNLFRGAFGIYLYQRKAGNVTDVPDNDGPQTWSLSARMDFKHWQRQFDYFMVPTEFHLPGDERFISAQKFVKPGGLPLYLVVSSVGRRTHHCPVFPTEDFMIRFRSEDHVIRATHVRWVGGVYRLDVGTRVVFDWGDGSDTVGMSFSGNWATHPLTKHFRAELQRESIIPSLMLFRRV